MSKDNHFVKLLKKINLIINSLLRKYLNKLNFNNLTNITRSNKVFLFFVALVILFLSYLSIPHIYNKAEIKKELKSQLLNKFNTNFIFSKQFNYKFFPRPQFTIEDSSIINNQDKISDVKKITIYISLNKLISLKNITIKDVILENANFNFDQKNYNFFIKLLDNNFLENSFKVKDSKIFYRNLENEVLFINKIVNMNYYYDKNELHNIIYSENEIFNVPYSFEFVNDKIKNKIISKLNLSFLKLQIENEINYNEDIKKGNLNFIHNKNRSSATYEFNKNLIVFDYFDQSTDPKFIYKGKINSNPFYSIFEGDIDKIDLSYLFKSNSFFIQLLKSEILNNKNLNIDLNINSKKISQLNNFINVLLNLKIKEGLIDIDNTKFSWDKYVDFKVSDSLLYLNNNNLILDGKLVAIIKNDKEIYKFLQTSKSLRPKINKLEFYFNYNFDQQVIYLNTIKVNDKISEKINNKLEKIILQKNKLQNKIYFKNIMKQAIEAYVG